MVRSWGRTWSRLSAERPHPAGPSTLPVQCACGSSFSASLALLLRRRPTGLRVGELMTSPAVTTTLSTSLAEAARCMRDNRIHRVVAIDEEGRPVGVLAASDFVALYADG